MFTRAHAEYVNKGLGDIVLQCFLMGPPAPASLHTPGPGSEGGLGPRQVGPGKCEQRLQRDKNLQLARFPGLGSEETGEGVMESQRAFVLAKQEKGQNKSSDMLAASLDPGLGGSCARGKMKGTGPVGSSGRIPTLVSVGHPKAPTFRLKS